MARASADGRLLRRIERMSSEALTVPWCSDPATRNKSSQLRAIRLRVYTGPRNRIQRTP